jgi:hypothetical protein
VGLDPTLHLYEVLNNSLENCRRILSGKLMPDKVPG